MEPHEVPTAHPQLINRAACCSSSPHKGPAHRLRFRYTPRMDAGNDRLWMTELECELSSVSLRGVRCGCSPAPTNASRDVANSILAMLRGWGAAWGQAELRQQRHLWYRCVRRGQGGSWIVPLPT